MEAQLKGSGTALPQPLNATNRINIMNTTGRINTTASGDHVEAGGKSGNREKRE